MEVQAKKGEKGARWSCGVDSKAMEI